MYLGLIIQKINLSQKRQLFRSNKKAGWIVNLTGL